ncbi:hypothetical protein [Streptomyces indicus]|uniref:Uncharacterized protein n=1 Tax=Streptomyces indicus TaxID=417292 RepID=A0A1G9D3U6_9ACTN|nr:hypothetical protein [Streptomyces indicus]SDK58608.1 hypothetical protein SAMN05421806_1096 [Streptomyces indicus]
MSAPAPKIAGFHEELWAPSYGPAHGSIRDHLSPAPYEDERQILRYLRSGHLLFSAMGSAQDVLGSGRSVVGGDSVYSDGGWVWRGDLWFYVRVHRLALPEAFLRDIREAGYFMPPEDTDRLAEWSAYVADRW